MTAILQPAPRAFLIALLVSAAVMLVNGLATLNGSWAVALHRPWWHPPAWLFGPAWSVILVMTAGAAALAWRHSRDSSIRTRLVQLFALNGLLNVFWSPLFFTAHRPDWAAADIFLLWISILSLVVFLWAQVRCASLLLIPYLAWVTFAFFLNVEIVQLNSSFATSAGPAVHIVDLARVITIRVPE